MEKHQLRVLVLEKQRQHFGDQGRVVGGVGPLQQVGRPQAGVDEAGRMERLFVYVPGRRRRLRRAWPARPAATRFPAAGAGRAVRRVEEGRQAIGVVGVREEARRVLLQAQPVPVA